MLINYKFQKMLKVTKIITTVVFAALAMSMTSCRSNGNNNQGDDAAISDFITEMYNNGLYSDYGFLEDHCSEALLQTLADEYEYDSEGVAYAVWKFRTESQDGKPDSDVKSEIVSVENVGDGWYEYEFYDGGWLGKNRIKVSSNEGNIMIESIEKVYDEFLEEYN